MIARGLWGCFEYIIATVAIPGERQGVLRAARQACSSFDREHIDQQVECLGTLCDDLCVVAFPGIVLLFLLLSLIIINLFLIILII
jgi:hypothetical protein